MKTLLLLRHAKSDWNHPGLADFDRPLAQRGRKAAVRMGKLLLREGLLPDLVLCSAAARAQETWHRAAKRFDHDYDFKLLRSLYLASPMQLLRQIRRADRDSRCVLLIAHNPGMAGLGFRLAGPGSSSADLERLAVKYPTAALACFDCGEAPWADLDWGGARLTRLICPRDLE